MHFRKDKYKVLWEQFFSETARTPIRQVSSDRFRWIIHERLQFEIFSYILWTNLSTSNFPHVWNWWTLLFRKNSSHNIEILDGIVFFFENCRFSYAGNWELVKSIVGTKSWKSHVCLHFQSLNLHKLVVWHLLPILIDYQNYNEMALLFIGMLQ